MKPSRPNNLGEGAESGLGSKRRSPPIFERFEKGAKMKVIVIGVLLGVLLGGCAGLPTKTQEKSFEEVQIEACMRLGGFPIKVKSKVAYSVIPEKAISCQFYGTRTIIIKHKEVTK